MTLPARTCGSAGAGPLIIIDLSGNQVLHGRTATSIGHELKTSSGDGLKQKTADVLSASHTGGSGGPLRVSEPGYIWELSRKFVEACRAAGIAPNADYNGTTQEGVGLYQTTTHKRRRWSAAHMRPGCW